MNTGISMNYFLTNGSTGLDGSSRENTHQIFLLEPSHACAGAMQSSAQMQHETYRDSMATPSSSPSLAGSDSLWGGSNKSGGTLRDNSPLVQTNALFGRLGFAKEGRRSDKAANPQQVRIPEHASGSSSVLSVPNSHESGLQEEKSLYLDIWYGCQQRTLDLLYSSSHSSENLVVARQSHLLQSLCLDQVLELPRFWEKGLLASSSMENLGDFIHMLALLPMHDWERLQALQNVDYSEDKKIKKMDIPCLVRSAFALYQMHEEDKAPFLAQVEFVRKISLSCRADEILCGLASQGYTVKKIQDFYFFCLDSRSYKENKRFDFFALLKSFERSALFSE